MKLFNFKDLKVNIEPEALLLAPFATIWDRDKSEGKDVAMMEFSYVWFMQDLKSDFFSTTDKDERSTQVKKVLINIPKGWKPDKKVKDAEEFYRKHSNTISSNLLRDSRASLAKISETLRDPDFNQIDIKKLVDTIRMLPALIRALDELEEKVLKERQSTTHRGSQERSIFEDGV